MDLKLVQEEGVISTRDDFKPIIAPLPPNHSPKTKGRKNPSPKS